MARYTLERQKITIAGPTDAELKAIGELVVNWARLEIACQMLIWDLLGIEPPDGRVVTARLDMRPKMEMLDVLTKRWWGGASPAYRRYQRLARRLNRIQEDRNLIMHGLTGARDPDGNLVIVSLRKDLPKELRDFVYTVAGGKSFSPAKLDRMVRQCLALTRAFQRLRDAPSHRAVDRFRDTLE